MLSCHRLLLALLLPAALLSPAWDQRPRPIRLPENVVRHADVEYGRAGDTSLKLDVYTPKAEAKKPLPVVVWIHGGGWQAGSKDSGLVVLPRLVATGDYAGVSVGYRLTSVTPWPGQIHDCKAAIRWIRANAKKYNFDPDRIGVWGASAGGHLVSMLGTSGDIKELEGKNGSPGPSSRVRCVVDFCGPSDFPAFARANPGMDRPGSPVGKLLGGRPSEKEDMARNASPITYVNKDDPPFLIVHGTADRTVPFSQAERLHAALRKAGVDSTLLRIEGGGHGIGGPEVMRRVRAFLDRHLLGKKVEVSAEPIKVSPRPRRN